jgi:hypothetical protein
MANFRNQRSIKFSPTYLIVLREPRSEENYAIRKDSKKSPSIVSWGGGGARNEGRAAYLKVQKPESGKSAAAYSQN